jgi:glyoxylase-like metal-dependent hydrolase (beta-lactamase superfamily II)
MDKGIYRFQVGAFECIVVNDGTVNSEHSPYDLFPNAPPALMEQMFGERATQSGMMISYNCLVVKTDERLLLVDTGWGINNRPNTGELLQNLRDAGIEPGEIDTVIITHGDGDHIGGVASDDGTPTFPNARYVMWRAAWEYSTSEAHLAQLDEEMAASVRSRLLPLRERIDLIDEETDLLPGVRVVPSLGHRPGHTALVVSSNGEQLLCVADALVLPFQLEHPDWHPVFDSVFEQAATTRRRLLEWAAEENMLLHAYHILFPGLGHVVPQGETWRWRPIEIKD